MSALMDMEEEGWRESLNDPNLTEAERADIMASLQYAHPDTLTRSQTPSNKITNRSKR